MTEVLRIFALLTAASMLLWIAGCGGDNDSVSALRVRDSASGRPGVDLYVADAFKVNAGDSMQFSTLAQDSSEEVIGTFKNEGDAVMATGISIEHNNHRTTPYGFYDPGQAGVIPVYWAEPSIDTLIKTKAVEVVASSASGQFCTTRLNKHLTTKQSVVLAGDFVLKQFEIADTRNSPDLSSSWRARISLKWRREVEYDV